METEEEWFEGFAKSLLEAMYNLGIAYQIQFPILQNVGPIRRILTEHVQSSKRSRIPVPLEVDEAANLLNQYFAELLEIGATRRPSIDRIRQYGIFDDTPEEDATNSAARVLRERFVELTEQMLQSPQRVWGYLSSNGYVIKRGDEWVLAQKFLEGAGQTQSGSYTIRVLRLFAQGRTEITTSQLMEMKLIPEYTTLHHYGRVISNMRVQGHLEMVRKEGRLTFYGITKKGAQRYQKHVSSVLST